MKKVLRVFNLLIRFRFFLLFFLFFWLIGLLIFLRGVPFSYHYKSINKTGALVILTGGRGRIEEGLSLFQKGFGKKLLITGVSPSLSKKELLRDYSFLREPFKKKDIFIDYKAKNTIENSIETKKWVEKEKIKSLTIITSFYHIPRSRLEFSRAFPQKELSYYPVIYEKLFSRKFFYLLLKEYHKWLYVAIKGFLF